MTIDKPSRKSLTEIMIEKIRIEGPVSFHDFMEMALYYPELGYYTSCKEKIGNSGDYYTSPGFTFIFGEMIAKQIEEMWRLTGEDEFTIVEYGAGPGTLCRDILSQLKNNRKLYKNLNYSVIEKSPAMREKEHAILPENVYWYDSISDMAGFTGCVLSNELLDNFSVHQVVMMDELMEVFVDYDKEFTECYRPAGAELKAYMEQLNVTLPKGFRTEINIEAITWLNEIADAMDKGFLLTIDYGCPSAELYNEKRKDGTLVCYNKHKVNVDPYSNIGEQDITAHVNFSALHHWGKKNGLEYCGYTDQANFLHALGVADHIRSAEQQGSKAYTGIADKAMLIHTLLMSMGRKFKVLIQQKGIKHPALSGMKFSSHLA